MKHIIFFLILFSSSLLHAQINSGGRHGKASHNKQIIGYVPQWDAWKGNSFGYSNKGVLNQLNLDYSQYTILNFSFFGVAKDGSLHSADLRNKQIYQSGTVQEPGEMLMKDVYSSWDYWILFGEIKPTWFIDAQAKAAGYEADGNGWKNAAQGISGAPFPIPLKKSGGPKGLIDLSHENGVKCLASIGGWSMSKHFATMAADPTMRATFIADCKKLIALGFDGIDIDWEFPGPFSGMNFRGSQADFANFTTLVTELRSAIGANKIISAAFNQSATKLNGFEWAKLDKQMDYFNIMSYDVHGGWSNVAGHNSPLFDYTNQEGGSASWNDTITALSNHGVNLNKVTMGMAFYGRGVVTDGNGALHAPTIKSNRLVQPDGPISTAADFTSWPTFEGVPYYTRIKNNFQGWTKHWDNEAMVPYLTKNGAFLSYDDPRSIGLKAKYVRDNNIGGVIVWTAFGDTEPGAVDSGSTKLPRSSTTKSPLINVVNNVFAGETIPGETLATSYISVASNNINEGNSGTSQLPFTISLSAPSNGSVSVNYTTSNGTALAGNDYTQSSGTVTFAKGETTKTVNIPVLGDSTTEINEHFTLTLSSATGSRLAIKSATGTILNDDNVTPTPKTPPTGTVAPTPPNLTITGTTVLEGNSGTSNAAATITLSKASTKTITADWVASNGTASAGIDYKAAMGTIIFSPGETSKSINIQIIGDTNNEPDETIALTLRNPNGATISTAMASITITNDDQTNPTTVTTNTTVRGLSTLASNRPIVMGYVNTLRSATGHEQTLSSTQIASEVKAIHWAGYDVIVHAFGEPIDSNGSLGESLGNFSAYQQSIISEAHTRNKSVILSIGGAYPARIAGQFHEIATNATKRANFIANVVNYISTKGYDGVDIDWEFPDVATGKPALTTLMKELYAAVKAKNNDYIVMFGTGPAYYMGGYDFAKLKDHADFFFYFGYDWKRATPSGANGPIKQPGSGAQWTNASDKLYEKSVRGGIQYVLDAGFPANKIICGLPFYGSNNISWSAVRDTWAADIAGYDAAIDPDAMEVKINNVWYTTPTAMKMKMNALLKSSSSVLNNQATIRGVGTWEIGHEHKSHPDLSKAFEEWIADYSGSPILPKLNVSNISVSEGNSATADLRFTVTIDRSASSTITVDYATSDGSATSSVDYLPANGTLTFAPGETTKTVTVTVSSDTNVEQNETVIFTLSNVSSNALINNAIATGTILDDDSIPLPSLTIAGTTIPEGNSGITNGSANITLSQSSTEAITVAWATSDGTASAGSDYTAASGTLTFAPGETSKSINIEIIGDTDNESDETITLTLRNPIKATLSKEISVITITNDDQAKVVDPSGWEHHYEGGNNAIDVAYTTPTGAHLWSSGFSGNIKVTNNGPDLENWAITFDAPWTTTGSGNAGSWSIKNGHHTITQPTWGGYKLTSGSEINIDFTGSGTWSEPTNFKFNGEELKEPNPNNVTLETWKTNNKITDLTADSNNNQLPDLIDFLTGNDLSTRAIDSTDILTPMLKILEINGKKDTYFCVALNVNPLAAGVEYRLEVSNDLVTWEGGRSQMLLYKTTTNADGRTHAIWRAASPIPNDPELQTFTRLIARVVSKSNTNTGSTGTGTPGNGGDSTNNNNDNSGTGSTSTTGPKGSPNAPSVSIQKDWTDGRGHKINWNTWGGEAATEWKLYQNGKLIHTGTITGKAPQTASYDYDLANIGSFTYTVELTNSVGSSTSKPSTFLTDFASPMNLKGQDTTSQVSQVTINAGVNTLTVEGGKTPYTVTVNHPAAISATVAGQTITINGTAGMRSGLKIIDADGAIRLIGVRVKNADGSLPGLPNYLSIGSVSEDSKPDLDFFADYQPNTRKNKWVDYRYIYINGGVKRKNVGWRTWTAPKDGERMRKFVRESIKRGMLPVIVWYNIPDGGEAYTTDLQHMQEEDYMQGYFEDLKFAIDIANEEAGDEMVLWVLEPDFIGYMAQNNEDPMTLMAKTDAAYSVGVLDTAAGDPLFPNTMRGLIESINYTLKKHSNNAYIGWQFNLWAFPAGGWVKGSKVGVKGLMRITDTQGMTAGRQTVRNEGLAVADYYTRCGILTHGADFISIDKYGLDAGSELKNDNPEASTWFWNAEHWGNYLYYCSALHERTGKNVMLWQLTIGHVNSSQLTSPYTNTLFPDHPNSPRDWEDSAPTFFFGDTFKPGAGNRYNWFSQNKGGYSDVTLNADGETITWGSHMKAARDAGVHIMLFGDGVGNSTRGRGDSNTDDFWWITATQDYYANPVPLKP